MRDRVDALRSFIDKDADGFGLTLDGRHDVSGDIDLDSPGARGKDESQRVGARTDTQLRVAQIRRAASLKPSHGLLVVVLNRIRPTLRQRNQRRRYAS